MTTNRITPTPEQLEAYQKAWKLAHDRFPQNTPYMRNNRRVLVANCMKKWGIPLQSVGEWTFIRDDWAEVLNRIAFEPTQK